MRAENNFDEQLEQLRAQGRLELKKTTARGGLAIAVLSLVLAVVFMYVFYLSPRRPIDITVVVFAIFGSVIVFALGIKRFLG